MAVKIIAYGITATGLTDHACGLAENSCFVCCHVSAKKGEER